jgi:hypothetical protein
VKERDFPANHVLDWLVEQEQKMAAKIGIYQSEYLDGWNHYVLFE